MNLHLIELDGCNPENLELVRAALFTELAFEACAIRAAEAEGLPWIACIETAHDAQQTLDCAMRVLYMVHVQARLAQAAAK